MTTISDALMIALQHCQAGRFQAAEQIYRLILQVKPDFAKAHSNMGVAFQGQGRLDEAIDCYRRALELKPDYADAHSNLGVLRGARGKLDEAVHCYRRALELKPDYAEAHNNLGNAFKDQGKLDEAVACYRARTATQAGLSRSPQQPGHRPPGTKENSTRRSPATAGPWN